MTHPTGCVTAAAGFRAAGVCCGIREGKKDLALLVSDLPAAAAGTFTTNRFCAAPVRLCRTRIAAGRARAIVANSGCANAATGDAGLRDAETVAAAAARAAGLDPAEVLTASTGRIGRRLPVERITAAMPGLVAALSREGGRDAAEAILTTDTRPKEAVARFLLGGGEATVGGMAKGAGMIHPEMATMLAFITTDAAVEPAFLSALLRGSVEKSFNRISVDGDRSTNDSVFILANGAAGNSPLLREDSDGARGFAEALDRVTGALAEMIVRDGEGASRFVEILIRGARDAAEAKRLGFAVANSPLVKTAIFGRDPNWGRILSSLGAAGVDFAQDALELFLQGRRVFGNGAPAGADEAELGKLLEGPNVRIEAVLSRGAAQERILTCDLTPDYVELNKT